MKMYVGRILFIEFFFSKISLVSMISTMQPKEASILRISGNSSCFSSFKAFEPINFNVTRVSLTFVQSHEFHHQHHRDNLQFEHHIFLHRVDRWIIKGILMDMMINLDSRSRNKRSSSLPRSSKIYCTRNFCIIQLYIFSSMRTCHILVKRRHNFFVYIHVSIIISLRHSLMQVSRKP